MVIEDIFSEPYKYCFRVNYRNLKAINMFENSHESDTSHMIYGKYYYYYNNRWFPVFNYRKRDMVVMDYSELLNEWVVIGEFKDYKFQRYPDPNRLTIYQNLNNNSSNSFGVDLSQENIVKHIENPEHIQYLLDNGYQFINCDSNNIYIFKKKEVL